jgi:tRNA modification GTPase
MTATPPFTETIVAVATPPGEGGIGIVRLSGPEALIYGRKLFSFVKEPARIESHRLYVGVVTLPDDGGGIGAPPRDKAGSDRPAGAGEEDRVKADRALFVLMRAPHSYTGEDVVELHCHGSPLLLDSIVTAALSLGARPADRGEFTRRAFMNGKIDLVQAESVADLISAKTTDGLSIFSRQLMGELSVRLSGLREALVCLLAEIEAAVDFSDQDIDPLDMGAVARELTASLASTERLIGSYRVGRTYREGARLVIAGRPNVGKSSLLNRLLGRPRAIVASEPGTTTDTIEDIMDLGGIPARIVDTCGLRETVGAVEREGVQRTRDALGTADVTLLVAEATVGIGKEERDVINAAATAGRALLVVMNKVDLVIGRPLRPADLSVPIVFTSALAGTGIDELKDVARSLIAGGASRGREEGLITNARHHAALLSVSRSLVEASAGATNSLPPEFIALDIRRALSALGEITGEVTTDEVLDRVFSRFCIGK